MISFYLDYLFKNLISKYSHIMNLEGHNSAYKTRWRSYHPHFAHKKNEPQEIKGLGQSCSAGNR